MTDQVLRESVLALVVTSGKSQYLSSLLDGLENQTLGASRIRIAVTDGVVPASLLADSPHISTVRVNAETFSEAATAAMDGDEPWVWLLHDDLLPDASCLDTLLRTGETSQKIGAVGPKQVAYGDRRALREVGIRSTHSGQRVDDVLPGELDQGQHDWREDVVALGSAGMLLRRSALDAIGGLDPVLGPFGDGWETSRRLWLGGWRVVVEPKAVIEHAQVSYRREGVATYGAQRGAQLYCSLLAAGPIFPLALLWAMIVALPRALWGLMIRERSFAAEFVGLWFVLSRFGGLQQARRRTRQAQTVPGSVLRSLEDRPKAVRHARREKRRVKASAEEMSRTPDPLELRARAELKASTSRWGIATVVMTVAVALAGLIGIVGRGVLTGGALLPDSWGAAELWRSALYGWLPSGPGSPGGVDPLWMLLSPLTLIFGSLGAVASALVLVGIPLAGLSAYFASRYLTLSPPLRFLSAVMWAFAPPLLAAVSVGQVASIVAHVVLPLFIASLSAHWRTRSITSIAAGSVSVVLLGAASPIFVLLAALVAILGFVSSRPRWRWLWLPIPALVVMGPVALRAWRAGDLWHWLCAVPGENLSAAPSSWSLIGLDPSGTVDGPLAIVPIAAIVALGMLALIRRHEWVRVRCGWVMWAAGLAWAAVQSTVLSGFLVEDVSYVPTTAWAGIGLSVAAAGLWLMTIGGLDRLSETLRQSQFGLRQIGAAGMVGVVTVGVFSSAVMWLARDAVVIEPANAHAIPAVAEAQQAGDERSRVLTLVASADGIEAQLWRGAGKELHETSTVAKLRPARMSASEAPLAAAIADVSTTGAVGATFSDYAIALVLVPPGDTDERAELVAALNSTSDLEYVTENESGAFWRVKGSGTARAVLSDGSESSVLPAGIFAAGGQIAPGSGRTLRLAETADPLWHATLDGEELVANDAHWYQEWTVPDHGGNMRVIYGDWRTQAIALIQASVIGCAAIAAIPWKRKRRAR